MGGESIAAVLGSGKSLDQLVATYSLQAVYVAAIGLGLLLLIAVLLRNGSESAKKGLFWTIASLIIATTGLLVGMTIYLNQTSVTAGPVHWHADFEVWVCGQKQDLRNPQGFSNKIGTPTLHEHDDLRIHVEGVVVNWTDVNLRAFFKVIGGELANDSLTIPVENVERRFVSGEPCPGEERPATLQVFAITADLQNRSYSQHKLADPTSYQFTQAAKVPPGDCLIIEFSQELDRTERLCQSYQVAKVTGEIVTEVPYRENNGH